jgi:hypothetical protein
MNFKKITFALSILIVIISCNNNVNSSFNKDLDSSEITLKIEENTIHDSLIIENDIDDTVIYDKIIAYEFEGSGDNDIVSGSKLIEKSKIYQEKEITLEKVKEFESILQNKNTYGGSTASCFDPHFGIVYYKNNKIVNYISVCLACNSLYASFDIPAQKLHKSTLCDECYHEGLNKKARKQISEFIKNLGFGHWELGESIFD